MCSVQCSPRELDRSIQRYALNVLKELPDNRLSLMCDIRLSGVRQKARYFK